MRCGDASMATSYFIRLRGNVQGPFDAERLRQLARRGQFTRLHEVSTDGQEWRPAGRLLAQIVQVPGSISEERLLTMAAERLRKLLENVPYRRRGLTAPPKSLKPLERIARLSPGEREVLRLYFESFNAKQVALRVGTRPQTVKNQLRAIERKLGVDSREAMLAFVFSLLLALHSPQ